MIKILSSILILLILGGCSLFSKNSRERKIQTTIIKSISSKSKQLSKCAKDSSLFTELDKTRVRVVLHLAINSQGQIEKFKLDNKNYPEDFSECVFKIVDLIVFPKIKNHEVIELEQPFIFSKK